MSEYPKDDLQFEEHMITRAEKENGGSWSITRSGGWSFFVPAGKVVPKVGSLARYYGGGIGRPVRGLFIDGQCVFYRAEVEQEAHFDDELYGRDATELLRRWDEGRSVWSVGMGGFGPGYEQALQLAAFEVLRHFLEVTPNTAVWEDDSGSYRRDVDAASAALMKRLEPLGLSGAQWGAAVHLAARFYRDGPIEVHKTSGEDRHIQVSRHFPSLPLPTKEASNAS